jgi:hypothetical protein
MWFGHSALEIAANPKFHGDGKFIDLARVEVLDRETESLEAVHLERATSVSRCSCFLL